ncbi:hypothetical protein [Streptomyces coffeae]|uniref:Uncharacterized protein n=1 Tax=Streptomyces coffeae TaxID=621382 RepID=A0ABS1NA90_9ACTN|nr:hypothetical protein [Streptomyces coffeae]MBL1096996.1 hypothetical protein [Streptomyces coffeae]
MSELACCEPLSLDVRETALSLMVPVVASPSVIDNGGIAREATVANDCKALQDRVDQLRSELGDRRAECVRESSDINELKACLAAADDELRRAEQALNQCLTTERLLQTSGKITFLLVQNVGAGFGPGDDFIDVEAVIQLDTEPGKAFGFTLRKDDNQVAHAAMLEVLRDAFNAGTPVTIDFDIRPNKQNGSIVRVFRSGS